MAGKKILLARPHAFIVSEMLPFLSGAGYVPQKLGALADLDAMPATGFAGVIISNAVISSVNASAEEVFNAVRKKMPRVPIIFAGLTAFALAKGAVERVVKAAHPAAEVFPVAEGTLAQPGLGRETAFVVLSKEDLGNPATLSVAEKILLKHFK